MTVARQNIAAVINFRKCNKHGAVLIGPIAKKKKYIYIYIYIYIPCLSVNLRAH